jgi:hypothetical protein
VRQCERERGVLCIVEQPSDIVAIEQATDYRGLYFVLGGRLSPLDGVGPEELGLGRLRQRLHDGVVSEAILAISPTVEGSATAHYITDIADGSRFGSRASPTACRWVANWSSSTAARLRTPLPAAPGFESDRRNRLPRSSRLIS